MISYTTQIQTKHHNTTQVQYKSFTVISLRHVSQDHSIIMNERVLQERLPFKNHMIGYITDYSE